MAKLQALGVERSDFAKNWMGTPYSRTYSVNIGDIREIQFHRTEYVLGHAWGYSDVDIMFKKN